MLRKLSSYALAVRDRRRTLKALASDEFKESRKTADIIRLVHAIEKGLCIENPRLGFGISKINKLINLCHEFAESFGNDKFPLKMARDAIMEYIDFIF